jgi:membrane-associated phospholipid phosphatase
LKILAHIFSVLGHPFIVLTYALALLLLVNPYAFGVHHISEQLPLLAIVFLYTFFLPLFATLMMKGLGLVSSLSLKDNKERIGPYIATGIFYLWTYQTLLSNPQIPGMFKVGLLGATIALFMAFFVNNFSRISTHAVGMGCLTGILLIAMFTFYKGSFLLPLPGEGTLETNMLVLVMLCLLFAGMVGTSRLILKTHEPMDVYGGFIVGIFAQFIALRILG